MTSKFNLSDDIKLNPAPKRDINQCFSVCHWNWNSVASHNFSKIQFLVTYNCIHKFDIIWLSEYYLNSKFLSSHRSLQIPGYIFARMDHPSNKKRGGVCLYCKCSLPLKVMDLSYFQEYFRLNLATEHTNSADAINLLAKQKMNLRIALRT